MSYVTFLTDNKILNANMTLSAGTENAQYPMTNIQHEFTTKVFRSNEGTVSIVFDLNEVSDIDMICLVGSSQDGMGFSTATIEGSATNVFTGTPVNINISHIHNFAFKELDPQTYRYWKLTLVSSPGGYVEVSNIYLGKKTQLLNNNISQGFSYANSTKSKVAKNAYSQRFIDIYNTVKTLRGSIKFVNAEEFEILSDIHNKHGENYPLWFMLDVKGDMQIADSEYIFSGYFYMDDLDWKHVALSLFDVNISLEEAK